MQTGVMKNLADLMVNKRVKETNKKNIAIVVGPVGTWVEIQTALLEVRLVGSVNDKIILLVAAKPNHKNLGLINHKKNHICK